MKRFVCFLVLGILLVAGTAAAQEPAKSSPTYEQVLTKVWKETHKRILEMAKEFPVGKFDSRPHPDARSFVEEMRHITMCLDWSTAMLRGVKFDYAAREKQDAGKPKTRESVVSEMEHAMQVSFAEVEKTPSPQLIGWLEHQGEHYGKLVTIYRLNNLVPPSTRAEQERQRQQQKPKQ